MKTKNEALSELFFENESKYNFDDTVTKLSEEIVKRSWNVSFVHDLQQTLHKHGQEVLPIKVFAICHPKHSGKILDKDDERIVSSLMPCRVSVYMKSDGKTYISRMNASFISNNVGGLIGEVMSGSASDVENILAEITK